MALAASLAFPSLASAIEMTAVVKYPLVGTGNTYFRSFNHNHTTAPGLNCPGAGRYSVLYTINYSYTAGSSNVVINYVRAKYDVYAGGITTGQLIIDAVNNRKVQSSFRTVDPGTSYSYILDLRSLSTASRTFSMTSGGAQVIGTNLHHYDFSTGCQVEDYIIFLKP
jgi:hypothetical protein